MARARRAIPMLTLVPSTDPPNRPYTPRNPIVAQFSDSMPRQPTTRAPPLQLPVKESG